MWASHLSVRVLDVLYENVFVVLLSRKRGKKTLKQNHMTLNPGDWKVWDISTFKLCLNCYYSSVNANCTELIFQIIFCK